MDDMGGYFKVYRKVQQSRFWTKKPMLEYRGLWFTLLTMANWKKAFFDGHVVKPGQLATSYHSLAVACKKSDMQIRTMLLVLKSFNMIEIENVTNRFSIITICNWETYNGQENKNQQTDNKPVTDSQQTDNKLVTTIEEGEERKEGKEGEEVTSVKPKKQHRILKLADESHWLAEIKAIYNPLGVDVDTQLAKARAWLLGPKGKGRKLTQQFFINWLSRADTTMTTSQPSSDYAEQNRIAVERMNRLMDEVK